MLKTVCLLTALIGLVSVAAAEPVPLGKGSQPRVVSDGGKQVAVVFARLEEIVIAQSNDGGKRFGEPRLVGKLPGLLQGMRRGPRVAMAGDAIVVIGIAASTGDLRAWASADSGNTWKTIEKPLNTASGSAREGLDALAASRDGRLIACVWLDLRNAVKGTSGTELWMSVSRDGGQSWEPDRRVYRNPGGSVCECCHPSIAIDDKNQIHVLFRNSLNGARDMYLTGSRDQGKTFTTPEKLGRGTWPLKGCPMDGGDLALDDKGRPQTIWMRNGHVFSASPGEDEKDLGEGRQPILVAAQKSVWTGWTRGRSLMGEWNGSKPVTLSDDATFPIAVAVGEGNVMVVWEQKQEILAERIKPIAP